jgi:hypothetical protein
VPGLALDGKLAVENAVLRAENAALRAEHEELERMLAALTQRVAELERRLACDSSNSSRPPSSDAPWSKKPAKKRLSRGRSGRKPGKQPGASSPSRSLWVPIGHPPHATWAYSCISPPSRSLRRRCRSGWTCCGGSGLSGLSGAA